MRILAAIDLHDRGDELVAAMVPWARRFRATLDLAFASEWSTEGQPRPPYPTPEIEALWAEWNVRAQEERVQLEAVLHDHVPADVRGVTRYASGRPVDVLPDLALGYDLLVTATHSRSGLERVLLGSVTARVIRNTRTPVLVIGRGDAPPDPSGRLRVLAPLAGDPGALPWIRDHLGGERVELVHVTATKGPALFRARDPNLPYEPLHQQMLVEALLHERAAACGFPASAAHVVPEISGNAGDAIARLAHDLPADVIVMPTHGRSGLDHLFMGSVAERVVERAPCPVIVVPFGALPA